MFIKRFLFLGLMTLWAFTLISWSPLARRTIALVAERHLTIRSKLAIQEILHIQKITDFNNNNRTASYNFFRSFNQNLYTTVVPPSLTIDQFGGAVKELRLNQMQVFIQSYIFSENPQFTQAQKTEALSLLMEVISEIQSPILIPQTGRRRSNTTRVKFEGQKTRLRNVWDSLLLAKQGLNATQLADSLDTAAAAQVAQWQTGAPNDWLFESYQIGTQIYGEVHDRRKLKTVTMSNTSQPLTSAFTCQGSGWQAFSMAFLRFIELQKREW
jgi:hypothetical protein